MTRKTIYFKDELNDDFSGITRNTVEIDNDFKYINRSFLWRLGQFLVYRVVMVTVAYLYCKLKFGMKVVNKDALKPYKKDGVFLFGNHTNVPLDGYIPNVLLIPKDVYFVVHPDNVSAKGTKTFMMMLGCLPLPSTVGAARNFLKALEARSSGSSVVIFPEAHVWPYYTDIRPFSSNSFKYPVSLNKPVFTFTTTYRKRRLHKLPGITVYVDGPLTADEALSKREQAQQIRDLAYKTMKERSACSNYEYIKYIKAQ